MSATYAKYSALWPETVILWGAGATASLGMPTTVEQGRRICELAQEDPTLVARVDGAFGDSVDADDRGYIVDLLRLLGDHEARRIRPLDLCDTYRRHFNPATTDKDAMAGIEKLRKRYNWAALACIVKACPSGTDADKFHLVDLFNTIDMHIESRHGFRVASDPKGSNFISPEELLPARNALKLLVSLMMFLGWKRALASKRDRLHQYLEFTRMIARLMQQEGLDIANLGSEYDVRKFYMCSYAVISLNWDPVLMWLIFLAHREHNFSPGVPHLGYPAVPMKLFNDLGYFLGVRRVEESTPLVWYPCDEGTVQRINDRDHNADRIMRIAKFYFPHASTSFRECPNCGKLVVAFGDKWDAFSETLFPPPILRRFSEGEAWARYRRCEQENHEFGQGNADSIICSHCGEMTSTVDCPLIMQSSYKGSYPPYLEEIQRDMRVALEKARHIVLLGYSLPSDDTIYRAMLSVRKQHDNPPFCTILNYDERYKDRGWLTGDQLPLIQNAEFKSTVVDQAVSIFGKDRVRACFDGMPDALIEAGSISETRVRDLLYPANVFTESIAKTRMARW